MIDVAVHPFVRRPEDLRTYMPQPWRTSTRSDFPEPARYLFPAPTGIPPYGEWAADSRPKGGLPASDPETMRAHLDAIGAERAILLPLTRGLMPDVDMGNVICSATNDWLAETWLGEWNEDSLFLGSIRVNPRDPDAAIREVTRWAGDRRMVQVAVPLEANQPYGQRVYFRLWEAIAQLDLPVAVRSDGGEGTDFYPTPNGYPHQFSEYAALYPLNYLYHLTSLIAEGVLERLPNLRFVFIDGGHDLLMPCMWRMDLDWPISKTETPWVRSKPSEYLEAHFRFATSTFEGPEDPEAMRRWWARSDGAKLLMFASHYPHWTGTGSGEWGSGLDDESRRRVLFDNAKSFYGLSSLLHS